VISQLIARSPQKKPNNLQMVIIVALVVIFISFILIIIIIIIENGLRYIETSAKTADNVDAAFLGSAEDIYHKMKRGEIFLESEEEKKAAQTVNAQQAQQQGPAEKKCCNFD